MDKIEESFQKVAKWAQIKGFMIVFEHNGHNNISFDDMIITINTSEGPETRLFSLLHECGHVLVCQDFQRYKEAFPGVWEGTIDKRKSRSKHYRVSLVEEEMLAWRRGRKLAKRLNIAIDEEKWNKHKADCLYTYLRWAVITVGKVHG